MKNILKNTFEDSNKKLGLSMPVAQEVNRYLTQSYNKNSQSNILQQRFKAKAPLNGAATTSFNIALEQMKKKK